MRFIAAIAALLAQAPGENGRLVSEDAYRDLTVRMKVKVLRGDAVFGCRGSEDGLRGISTGPKGGIAHGKPNEAKPSGGLDGKRPDGYRPGEWNELTISARGTRVVVQVNGRKTAELADEKALPLEGRLTFDAVDRRLLRGPDEGAEVGYRDVEILGDPKQRYGPGLPSRRTKSMYAWIARSTWRDQKRSASAPTERKGPNGA